METHLNNLSIYDLCLKITSAFEGASFDTVSGNFDSQGLSVGILQFNLGQGTLQRYILNFCDVDNYRFPVSIRPLQKLSPDDSVKWAKDTMLDARGNVLQDWVVSWREFLTDPVIINLQKKACDKYFHRAKEICGELGFSHDNRRAMVFSYDLAVQSWSLGINRPQINDAQCESIIAMADSKNAPLWMDEKLDSCQKILLIASHLRSLKCNPQWQRAFFVRKATIAIGIGYVNGEVKNYKNLLR